GGARGMGAAEARLFVREGARVVIGDVLEKDGQAVEAELRAKGAECVFVRLDVTSEADWQLAVALTDERFGAIHVLVNNAGIGAVQSRVADTAADGWDKVMAVSANGVSRATRAAIPAIRRAGPRSISH